MNSLTDDAMLIGEPSTESVKSSAVAIDAETAGSSARESTPHNSYSEVFWHWPSDFDGFEEFVKESRKESGYGREPPPWW